MIVQLVLPSLRFRVLGLNQVAMSLTPLDLQLNLVARACMEHSSYITASHFQGVCFSELQGFAHLY